MNIYNMHVVFWIYIDISKFWLAVTDLCVQNFGSKTGDGENQKKANARHVPW